MPEDVAAGVVVGVVAGVLHAANRATADKAPRVLMFIFRFVPGWGASQCTSIARAGETINRSARESVNVSDGHRSRFRQACTGQLQSMLPLQHSVAALLSQPANLPAEMAVYVPSGDQAGSEASAGVSTGRSLKPVISTETRREENPRPRASWDRVSRQNISTRPFGAKVGPSTSHPSDRIRSPDPSGCITPMAKLEVSPA